GKRLDRFMHAARNPASERATPRHCGAAQQFQLCAELIKNGDESRRRRTVGALDGCCRSERFNDEIDRAVLQMQAFLIRQQSDLRARHRLVSIGQGFSACGATTWGGASGCRLESGRIWSICPPSLA